METHCWYHFIIHVYSFYNGMASKLMAKTIASAHLVHVFGCNRCISQGKWQSWQAFCYMKKISSNLKSIWMWFTVLTVAYELVYSVTTVNSCVESIYSYPVFTITINNTHNLCKTSNHILNILHVVLNICTSPF